MSWNRDGSVHTLEGTAGAFLILPLVKAFEKTHKEKITAIIINKLKK